MFKENANFKSLYNLCIVYFIVDALKAAIRLLKHRIETKEERDLKKVHHLLRTNRPGVYSDIYCK